MNEFSLSQEEAVNYVKNTGKLKTLSVRAFGPSGPGLFTYTRVKYNTLFSGFRYLTRFSQKTEEVLSGLSSNHQFYSKKVARFF